MAHPPIRISLLIWALAASFYLFGFFQRVTPGVLTEELTQAFDLNRAGLGNLSAFYFYFYAAMQIPVGLLVDRVGPRKILALGALLAGVGAMLFGLADEALWASVGRGLIGGSVAVAWVSMLMLVSAWFSPRYFATMSGLSLAVGTMGAVLAGVPLRYGTELFGWRPVMLASAAFSIVLALLIWLMVRNHPTDKSYHGFRPPQTLEERAIPVLIALKRALSHGSVWLVFWIPSGVCGAFLTFSGLWGVPYLTTQYGLNTTQASSVVTGMLIAFAAGSLFFGWWSDKIAQRKVPFLVGGLATLIAYLLMGLGLMPSLGWATALIWLSGFGSGAMVLSFGFVRESVPHALGATAVGIVNLGVMVGPLVQQPLLGWVLDYYAIVEQLKSGYSNKGLQMGMLILATWVCTSLVALLLTTETHAKPKFAD